MSTPSTSLRLSGAAIGTLLASSAVLTGLAVYQWYELLLVRAGGTPACAVNETFNCAKVWNSAFALRVHEMLGMPVAALGVLWGLTAVVLSSAVLFRQWRRRDVEPFLSSVKLWAVAGGLACVTFISASVGARAVCFTCLGTYVLTAAFCVGAFFLSPGPRWPQTATLVPGAAWALVLSAPLFLGLLAFGRDTPRFTTSVEPPRAGQTSAQQLSSWAASLSDRDKLQAAYARDVFLKSQPHDVSAFPVRVRKGPLSAPLRIVDFTDVLCGHCRLFEDLLLQLEGLDASGISVEPRHYPLDGECNPEVSRTSGDGIRCLGAKLQLCLENHPRYFALRHELFANQDRLSQEFLFELAGKAGLGRDALMACVNSPETKKKLADDIAYAKRYGIEGTPLVLINGKEAPPAPAFLIGLLLAKGDAQAPFFQQLPPARRE